MGLKVKAYKMRIQIEINDEERDAIDALILKAGLKTKKELFNNALAIFEWALNEKKNGRSIASIDKDNEVIRELLMPTLSRI